MGNCCGRRLLLQYQHILCGGARRYVATKLVLCRLICLQICIAAIRRLDTSIHQIQDSDLPTLEAIAAEKRERQAQAAEQARKLAEAPQSAEAEAVAQAQYETEVEGEGGLEGLEEEAEQQSAFNPETGEINWDCPCLGGMAHGPCGEEFKEAFSCFVYSKEEPKGMECIEKFKWVWCYELDTTELTFIQGNARLLQTTPRYVRRRIGRRRG